MIAFQKLKNIKKKELVRLLYRVSLAKIQFVIPEKLHVMYFAVNLKH